MLHFTWNSGAGLAVDLGVFALLVSEGASGFRANIASSSVAVTVVYFLVTRFSFRVVPTWRTYAAFLAWYGTSAALVSLAITLVSHGDASIATVAKLCSVPVTFATNFLFSRWLFAGGAERILGRLSFRPRPIVVAATLLAGHRDLAVAGIVAIWFRLLILPVSERLAFSAPGDPDAAVRRSGAEWLFVLAVWGGARFVLRFAAQLRAGSLRHRRWLAISAAVLAINLAVFLLVYPGYWVWDEFGVLSSARTAGWYAWQGYLTNLYYDLSMFLIPSAVGVVVVQLVFAAVVSGYVVSLLCAQLARPWLALLCAVPVLSVVTLLNNEYPLRLTAYSYLLVLALARLVVAWRSGEPVTSPAFVGFGVAVAILAFWRTEGLVMLLLLPVYILAGRYRARWRARPRATVAAVLAVAAAIAASGWVTTSMTDPRYQVTAIANPVSTMLQHRLASPDLAADLRAIDRVIPVQALKANPSYTETPAFWTVGVRPGYEAALPGMRSAYFDLVLHNPGPFLANRWHAFLATNSMQADYLPQIHAGAVFGTDPATQQAWAQVTAVDPAFAPLDPDLRATVVRTLLLTGRPTSSFVSAVVWNAAPTIVALLGLLVFSLLRRRRAVWAVCSGTLLAQAALIFLTSPAAFFMYYLPCFLAGGLLLASLAAGLLDTLLLRRTAMRALAADSSIPDRRRLSHV